MAISLFAPVVIWNSDRLSYYYTAWSLEGVTISRLYGFNDTLKYKVHTIELEVEEIGPMVFRCHSPRQLISASDIYLVRIGPYIIDDIIDQLIASEEFTATQQRFLAANRNGGLNIGTNGVFFESSPPSPKSIQDAAKHYDDIMERIEKLLGVEEDARPTRSEKVPGTLE